MSEGKFLTCSQKSHPRGWLFYWTDGGLGLQGAVAAKGNKVNVSCVVLTIGVKGCVLYRFGLFPGIALYWAKRLRGPPIKPKKMQRQHDSWHVIEFAMQSLIQDSCPEFI